jgi:hypothetical protein
LLRGALVTRGGVIPHDERVIEHSVKLVEI